MTAETKYPTCQDMMDLAYATWQQRPAWTYSEFIDELPPHIRCVALLGNLNYQVENGGFLQWCDNGYVACASDVLRALDWLGGEEAARVRAMVHDVTQAWGEYQDDRRRSGWNGNSDDVDAPDFDAFDAEYYAGLGDALLGALESRAATEGQGR